MKKIQLSTLAAISVGGLFGLSVNPASAATGVGVPPVTTRIFDSVVSAGGQPVPQVNNLGPSIQPNNGLGQTFLVPLWQSPIPAGDANAARNCKTIKQIPTVVRPAGAADFPVRFNPTIQYPAQMQVSGIESLSTGRIVINYGEQINLTKSPGLYFTFEGCLVNFGLGDVACNPATSNGPKMLNNETIQVSGANINYTTQVATGSYDSFSLKTGVGWWSQNAPLATDKVEIVTCYPEMTVYGEYTVIGVGPL